MRRTILCPDPRSEIFPPETMQQFIQALLLSGERMILHKKPRNAIKMAGSRDDFRFRSFDVHFQEIDPIVDQGIQGQGRNPASFAGKGGMRNEAAAIRSRGMKVHLPWGWGNRPMEQVYLPAFGRCAEIFPQDGKQTGIGFHAGQSQPGVSKDEKKGTQPAVGPEIQNAGGFPVEREIIDPVFHNFLVAPIKRKRVGNPEGSPGEFHGDFPVTGKIKEAGPALQRGQGQGGKPCVFSLGAFLKPRQGSSLTPNILQTSQNQPTLLPL